MTLTVAVTREVPGLTGGVAAQRLVATGASVAQTSLATGAAETGGSTLPPSAMLSAGPSTAPACAASAAARAFAWSKAAVRAAL